MLASTMAYYLIKFVPLWGLSLIGTCAIYLGPFIYIQNKQFIDEHLGHAHSAVVQQGSQIKDLAAQHTGRATEVAKQYAGDYTSKAQGYIGSARGTSASPEPQSSNPAYKAGDFPHAPKQEPTAGVTGHAEQEANSQFAGKSTDGPIPS